VLRLLAIALGAAGVGALALSWIPDKNYHPIQPDERGTITQGVAAVRRLPSGNAPLQSQRDATAHKATATVTPTTTPSATQTTTPAQATSTTAVRSSTNTTTRGATTTTSTPRSTTTAAPTTTTVP
jgi:hypothetical protein